MNFFFCLVLYVLLFFGIYIYIKTYRYIVLVINSKLVIGYDILKNILAQNQPNCTLYTTLYRTCDCKLRCGVVIVLGKLHCKIRC